MTLTNYMWITSYRFCASIFHWWLNELWNSSQPLLIVKHSSVLQALCRGGLICLFSHVLRCNIYRSETPRVTALSLRMVTELVTVWYIWNFYTIDVWVFCWCVIQEEWPHIPVAGYQDNLSITEAYNDPQLQPVVVMKKLDESRLYPKYFHL